MADSARPDCTPSPESRLRAFLAELSPEERTVLGHLLAAGNVASPKTEAVTIAHEEPPRATDSVRETLDVEAPRAHPSASAARRAGETLASPSAAPEAPVQTPVIPGYEIAGEIGRGGMGVVYLARHVRLRRPVALKMILSGSAAAERDVERFRAEAQTIAQFQHPHIVQVFEVGECQVGTGATCPYMALEYCPGGSLATLLDGRPWDAAEAAGLIELLARTVHEAHRAGIVHRDLKPANILLAPRRSSSEPGEHLEGDRAAGVRSPLQGWTPKITDFGLAKRLEDGGRWTQTGAILGTPEYMAPEQALGSPRAIGPLADVYALGAILYELLTGSPPLQAGTPLETVLLVVEKEPLPLRTRRAAVPRNLETICLKCLRKEPGNRYASALELADDLRRHLDGEPIRARPPGPLERANRHLKQRPGLTVACLLFAVAALLFLELHGLYLPNIFAMNGVSVAGFKYAAVPTAVLTMMVVLLADLRRAVPAALLVALGGVGAWLAWPSWRPVPDPAWLFLRPLAWGGLAAALAGQFSRQRGLLLFLFVPALLLGGGAGWLLDHGSEPFLAGACHGLLLGALVRIVAWGLHRDAVTCALGALLGAGLGIQVADWYGVTMRRYLRDSGIGPWHPTLFTLYLQGCLAFALALVAGLLAGKRSRGEGG